MPKAKWSVRFDKRFSVPESDGNACLPVSGLTWKICTIMDTRSSTSSHVEEPVYKKWPIKNLHVILKKCLHVICKRVPAFILSNVIEYCREKIKEFITDWVQLGLKYFMFVISNNLNDL